MLTVTGTHFASLILYTDIQLEKSDITELDLNQGYYQLLFLVILVIQTGSYSVQV
jgi:hypothetical protein